MTTSARESPNATSELTAHYRRARTWFEFASGTLLLYSALGIHIGQQPVNAYNVTIAHPDVLLPLIVAYTGYRTILEWSQCTESCRKEWLSEIDFGMACTMAVASILVFVVQPWLGRGPTNLWVTLLQSLPYLMLVPLPGCLLFLGYRRFAPPRSLKRREVGAFQMLGGAVVFVSCFQWGPPPVRVLVVLSVFSGLFALLVWPRTRRH